MSIEHAGVDCVVHVVGGASVRGGAFQRKTKGGISVYLLAGKIIELVVLNCGLGANVAQ